MYELIQVGERTYYIDCPAKMGLYQLNGQEVCLVDSGNDKDAAKKVLRLLDAKGWRLKMVVNTHSHADHIGGNALLQQRQPCPVYAPGIDRAFAEFPLLEPSFLYGGYPCRELRNKFLLAQPSNVQPLIQEVLPEGLELLRLDGHSFAMAALKTSDEVWFLADCLTSERILEKYHISFLYDVRGYIASLQRASALEGKLFIPAHAEPAADIGPLIQANLAKVQEVIGLLCELCREAATMEEILQRVFLHYGLAMDFNQYVLVGSTVRSYLSYCRDEGLLDLFFQENRLYWQTVKE